MDEVGDVGWSIADPCAALAARRTSDGAIRSGHENSADIDIPEDVIAGLVPATPLMKARRPTRIGNALPS
jgi:hypothetical protein